MSASGAANAADEWQDIISVEFEGYPQGFNPGVSVGIGDRRRSVGARGYFGVYRYADLYVTGHPVYGERLRIGLGGALGTTVERLPRLQAFARLDIAARLSRSGVVWLGAFGEGIWQPGAPYQRSTVGMAVTLAAGPYAGVLDWGRMTEDGAAPVLAGRSRLYGYDLIGGSGRNDGDSPGGGPDGTE